MEKRKPHRSPVIKMARIPIFFLRGCCSFQSTGIGSDKTRKSLKTLMLPCVIANGISIAVSVDVIEASPLCPGFGMESTAYAIKNDV